MCCGVEIISDEIFGGDCKLNLIKDRRESSEIFCIKCY